MLIENYLEERGDIVPLYDIARKCCQGDERFAERELLDLERFGLVRRVPGCGWELVICRRCGQGLFHHSAYWEPGESPARECSGDRW